MPEKDPFAIPSLLKKRIAETEANLNAEKEHHRKLYLFKFIWVRLFPIADRSEAYDAMDALIQESVDKAPFLEYLGRVYDTNGKSTKIVYIQNHADKVKIMIDYILGYRPDLESSLPEKALKKAILVSENSIKQRLLNLIEQDKNN